MDCSKVVLLSWVIYVISVLFCCAFVHVCLLMSCGHLLGKGWPLGPRLWCLIVTLSLSHWYPGSGVVLDCIDSWSLTSFLLCIIAYELRISCKGSLSIALGFFFVTSKTNFMFFKQHPWLFTFWQQCWVRHSTLANEWVCVYVNICTIWRITQNLVKNIISNVASSYQVNLAIEIPNITENYMSLYVFSCRHWVSAMLI